MKPWNNRMHAAGLALVLLVGLSSPRRVEGQDSSLRYGPTVPPAVRLINQRSLEYLAGSQVEDGTWESKQDGPGITGICVMAFLASGEDPDFGPYAVNIRKALRNLIMNQDAETGYISHSGRGSMYHHGLAMLALSEAYGAVDDRLLWEDSGVAADQQRTIGEALELAVRLALTSQEKNPWGAWRYSPGSQDADTTVSGTVLMGLLGARNAGIEVPKEAIDKALGFFRANTMPDGSLSYQPTSNHGNGLTRTAIGTLVYSVANRKDLPEYSSAAEFIKSRIDEDASDYPFYGRYYMAQALFHCDLDSWILWNQRTIEKLRKLQKEDGSFWSNYGEAYGTGMSVLALALNYRLLPIYER